MKLEKFLEFFWKEMLYLKFKSKIKPYFLLCLTFLPRQLDKDDANDDENDIDIVFPGQTSIEHFVHHESIRTAVGYFAQGSCMEQ